MTRTTLTESCSARIAKIRHKSDRSALLRRIGGRGAATLLLGTALSAGGMSTVLEQTHFRVEKSLDSVRVVSERGSRERVLANLHDGFAANSVFKLARLMPDRLVSRELTLFEEGWIPGHKSGDVFFEQMARINDVIQKSFFTTAVPYGDLIHAKAEKYDVDPALVAAVIEAESRFKRSARSQVGAKGLMQLMPRTGRWMGATDLYDPEQNVDAGVKYIKYLQRRFDGNLSKTIAAYNAGEGNVRRYNGIPPFGETQMYVKKVLRNYEKHSEGMRKWEQERVAAQ